MQIIFYKYNIFYLFSVFYLCYENKKTILRRSKTFSNV